MRVSERHSEVDVAKAAMRVPLGVQTGKRSLSGERAGGAVGLGGQRDGGGGYVGRVSIYDLEGFAVGPAVGEGHDGQAFGLAYESGDERQRDDYERGDLKYLAGYGGQ